MRTLAQRLAPPLAAVAFAFAANAAQAAICFLIHDAKDVVVYRDWSPPFDGALDFASPEREALRARNLHFSYFEATICQPVSMTATGAPKVASVDAIIASIPNSRPTAHGIYATTPSAGGGFDAGGVGSGGVVVVPEGGYGGGYGTYGGGYGAVGAPYGVGSGVVERARDAGAAVGARPAARR